MKSTAIRRENSISNFELESFINLQAEYKDLKDKLEVIHNDLAEVEQSIMQKYLNDAYFDDSFTITINETSRRNIEYKKELIKAIGENAVNRIVENTEPTIYKKLSVVKKLMRVN